MRVSGAPIIVGLAVLAAAPVSAQPAGDPIDALLQRPPQADAEEPDAAAAGAAIEAEPEPPAAPRAYVPPSRSTLTAPVFVQETGKNPDGPPSPAEAAYDSRVRSSAASVQGFQGPMDGGWTLSVGGRALYALQLVDRGGAVEGAWRDLRRAGALDASGFFEAVERAGADVTFHFSETTVAVVHAEGVRWAGQFTEAGRTEAVSLTRRVP